MSNKKDLSTDSIRKRQKILEGDEQEQLAKPALNFGGLPRELQDAILFEAAVALRLECETFKEVFVALALVCKPWRELLREAVFYARVKQQTFTKDPMCRYLREVQAIPVAGFKQEYDNIDYVTSGAVTLGDRFFTLEYIDDYHRAIFVYDVDYRFVRHEDRKERKVTISNRRQLVLSEPIDVQPLMASCSRTKSLYVLQQDKNNDIAVNATVLGVSPEDGMILKRWGLDVPWYVICSISVNSTGTYLIVTVYDKVFVYDTSSGVLVKAMDGTDENRLKKEMFVSAVLLNESPESLITTSASMFNHQIVGGRNLAVDDYHCRLQLDALHFTLYDNRTGRTRKLCISKLVPCHSFKIWYDEEHGLVFCLHYTGMTVMRVTY